MSDPAIARQRIFILESEIRALKQRTPTTPPRSKAAFLEPVAPLDDARRALFLLVEMADHQVSIGDQAGARRSIADAVTALEEIQDDPTLARASVLIGEALLRVDAAQHAKPRFQRAVTIFEGISGGRWEVRARIGLGRTLVALDDPRGTEILMSARELCLGTGDTTALTEIEAALAYAEKIFDTPRSVMTGYGRLNSTPPKRK